METITSIINSITAGEIYFIAACSLTTFTFGGIAYISKLKHTLVEKGVAEGLIKL